MTKEEALRLFLYAVISYHQNNQKENIADHNEATILSASPLPAKSMLTIHANQITNTNPHTPTHHFVRDIVDNGRQECT